MESQAVQKFMDMVKADEALISELQTAMMSAGSPTAALEKAVEMAQARGLRITVEELQSELPRIAVPGVSKSGELSDGELASVSGGRFYNWAKETIGSTTFACYICAMGSSG
jgi:hypothetical protein